MPINKQSPQERFEQRVVRGAPGACWDWTGQILPNGYAQFHPASDGKVYAHVWSYEHHVGPVPEGLEVEHECHTSSNCQLGKSCPHRKCTNPEHLRVLTHEHNSRLGRGWRPDAEGVWRCARGHACGTDRKGGQGICRECRRKSAREYMAERPDGGVTRSALQARAKRARKRSTS